MTENSPAKRSGISESLMMRAALEYGCTGIIQAPRGELVDSADSKEGYENRMPEDRARNTNNFANVNFIFPDLTDGSYWVVVDHLNHLPVMSRFAAPFIYEGDVHNTWAIESGWDFQTWNGEEDNVLPAAAANPYANGYFTAYGPAVTDVNDPLYSNSGLIFNEGMGRAVRTDPYRH